MKGIAPKKAMRDHIVLNWLRLRICQRVLRTPMKWSTIWKLFTLLKSRETPKISVKNSRKRSARKMREAARSELSA